MGSSSVGAADFNSILERALDDASSGLRVAADELGAEAVAVLFCAGARVEITYGWSNGGGVLKQQISNISPSQCDALKRTAGLVEARNPLANVLRELISPQSRSFLLYTWRMQQRVVTVVFCFAAPQPPHVEAPDRIAEKVSLIGLATWSVREIAGLRSQLQTVTNRLAGRKLVERAKGLLQSDQGISEAGAYEQLRKLSRKRRITLAALAEEFLRERAVRSG